MTATYSFQKQLAEGERWEEFLDGLFAADFEICRVGRADQRRGIDRIFIRRANGRPYRVEYKADRTAARTGNAFIELVSVDTANKPGWAITSQAEYLVYYIVGIGPAYIIRLHTLRQHLHDWSTKYERRRVPNRGYHTVGLLVPLDELKRIAVAVYPA